MARILVVLGLVCGAILGSVFLFQDSGNAPTPPVAEMAREKVAKAIVAGEGVGVLGRLEPRARVVRVSYDAGSEIEQLHVREGQEVAAGDRIATLEHGDIVAPIAGTILKIHAQLGARVGDAGIADMADLTQIDAVAEVSAHDMAGVHEGQRADVLISGVDQPLTGEVREILYANESDDANAPTNHNPRMAQLRVSIPEESAFPLRNMIYRQVDIRILP